MSGKKLSPRQLGAGRLPGKSTNHKEPRKRKDREDEDGEMPSKHTRR